MGGKHGAMRGKKDRQKEESAQRAQTRTGRRVHRTTDWKTWQLLRWVKMMEIEAVWLQQAQGMLSGTAKSQMHMFSHQVHPLLGTKLNAREFFGAKGEAKTRGNCIMIATQTPTMTLPRL